MIIISSLYLIFCHNHKKKKYVLSVVTDTTYYYASHYYSYDQQQYKWRVLYPKFTVLEKKLDGKDLWWFFFYSFNLRECCWSLFKWKGYQFLPIMYARKHIAPLKQWGHLSISWHRLKGSLYPCNSSSDQ